MRGGLPYEECRRRQYAAPRDRAPLYPAFAVPPFRPRARRRRGWRPVDGAVVSGVLCAVCVAALLVAVVVAATLPA
ncbi:hypothetical protein ABZX30_02505 [Streptomyces sp. NPDC004542]|uniref:hypothetical protein n=1 Tax=Streptomyces sp. NPDC004542 TaxID=3154281 RepID=UPI0033BBC7C1